MQEKLKAIEQEAGKDGYREADISFHGVLYRRALAIKKVLTQLLNDERAAAIAGLKPYVELSYDAGHGVRSG